MEKEQIKKKTIEFLTKGKSLALSEGKKTYKEFSLVKTISYGFIGVATITLGSIYSMSLLPKIISLVGVTASFLLGAIIAWQGIKWLFPRYMILNWFFNRRHKKRTCSYYHINGDSFYIWYFFLIMILIVIATIIANALQL